MKNKKYCVWDDETEYNIYKIYDTKDVRDEKYTTRELENFILYMEKHTWYCKHKYSTLFKFVFIYYVY